MAKGRKVQGGRILSQGTVDMVSLGVSRVLLWAGATGSTEMCEARASQANDSEVTFQMTPYSLYSAPLTRAPIYDLLPYGPWSKGEHYIGNRMVFGM